MLISMLAFYANAREIHPLERWEFLFAGPHHTAITPPADGKWEAVRVPHDWAIDKPFDMRIDMQSVRVIEDGDEVPQMRTGRTGALPAYGVGYYRTEIESTPAMKGQRIRIEFDGAMSLAQVYLNDKLVGKWAYGYTSFAFDLTENWNYNGKNKLMVRLNNKEESSRWYPGAGLYRNVRLIVSNPVHVAYQGTNIKTPQVSNQRGKMQVETLIHNFSDAVQKIRVVYEVKDAEGTIVAHSQRSCTVKGKEQLLNQTLTVKRPQLWSIDSPRLYTLTTRLFLGEKAVDSSEEQFGFRTIRFDKDKGFFLNEQPVKMQGVCLHHDLGPLGAAVSIPALKRQLDMMKEMGCNAIRTSHNPASPELIQLCDQLGFVVIEEAFDEWRIGKNANGYHVYFDEWSERDIQAMIRRDRNHPCIVAWSIGNEIREQGKKEGAAVARRLTDICHREDPTRPVTAGFNNHKNAIKNGLATNVDLVGFNYKPYDYKAKHLENPDFILYGSETASTVSSRGEYKFPVKEYRSVYYEDYQVSSYDLEYPAWASTPDTEFEQQDDCPFIFGEFVWTGFDYLGEPTPYNSGTPAKSSYFGIVDLAGLKKDRFYLYQSKWSDKKVVHLLPHWNWEERLGQNVPVFCYTNYPKAELFVNGKSMGIRTKSQANKYERYRLMWKDVTYQPGEIKVVAYNEQNLPADTVSIKTAGSTYRIRLTTDRQTLKADGKDLAFVTVEVLDKDGNLCPKADNLIFFDVEGAGRLKAVCNGNPIDQTPFSSTYMRTFNGKLVVILESGTQSGDLILKTYGGHLLPGTMHIQVKD